jgi:glycosyltransferase involved in cell wall biosynthesis
LLAVRIALHVSADGGVGVAVSRLFVALTKMGHDVYCILGVSSRPNMRSFLLKHGVSDDRILEYSVNYSGQIARAKYLVWLFGILRSMKFDVLNIQCPGPIPNRAAATISQLFPKLRVVTSQHGMIHEEISEKTRAETVKGMSLFDAVVVLQPMMKDDLISLGASDEQVSIIPPLNPYFDRQQSKEVAKAALGIPAESFVGGMVTRIDANKRVTEAIKAFAQGTECVSDARFVLAGDGELRNETIALGEKLLGDRFHYLGWVDSSLSTMEALDVHYLLSGTEGFPLSISEASHLGIPTISTRTPGASAQLVNDHSGFLVPIAEPWRAAACTRSLAESVELRNRMGKNAQEMIRLMSPEVLASAYLRVYSGNAPSSVRVELSELVSESRSTFLM